MLKPRTAMKALQGCFLPIHDKRLYPMKKRKDFSIMLKNHYGNFKKNHVLEVTNRMEVRLPATKRCRGKAGH